MPVAVLALQTQALHVMLVAERDRLIRPLALPRHPRRTLQLVQRDAKTMTIKPVSTRLARASAFELRSKTCAMDAFLVSSFQCLDGSLQVDARE